ncbi:hypothetical protein PFISCL1PPCAC_21143, partial [Pristionchus fissidentatus]
KISNSVETKLNANDFLSRLSKECLIRIFEKLDIVALDALERVSHRIRSIAKLDIIRKKEIHKFESLTIAP